jgi:3-deoxy-D-manno-octulosonic acid kinase
MSDFQQKTLDAKVILFDPAHFTSPGEEVFSNQHWQSQNAITGQALGRGTTYFFQLNEQEYVLRHYHRGGLIGKLLDDQYFYTSINNSRAWQEFNLLKHMQTLDLPCPKPIAAMVSKQWGYYQADIILSKIKNAKDLHQILLTQKLSPDTWQTIGQTIAQFHNHQIYHHDLNIHNIMLDKAQQPWLIDFDKCRFRTGEKWKVANLERLERSMQKEKRLNPNYFLDDFSLQFLLEGYNGEKKHK